MSAREKCPKPGCGALKLIAKPCTDFDCPQDWSVKRLTAAGYTIIPPGGMHEPTLETLSAARKFIARFDGKMPTAREDEGVFALLERIDEALAHEGDRKG